MKSGGGPQPAAPVSHAHSRSSRKTPHMREDAGLAFAHIGDLHIAREDEQNVADYFAIVDELNRIEGIDFVYLPGDNADNGTPGQYAVVRSGLDRLKHPAHVITGDHDIEPGNLSAFYGTLGVPALPYAIREGGVRCLFLDMCGEGSGGPDFRLGAAQIAWLRKEIAEAESAGEDLAVFMHSYPADLKGGEADEVSELLSRSRVRLVEIGHTHYNELSNDGRTIYAAVRSTGQIEEGPVGYAIGAIDGGVVSWRFKELSTPWPLVMITAPADRRLAHDEAHLAPERFEVRALAFGDRPIERCSVRIEDGPWLSMARHDGDHRFRAVVQPAAGARRITVRAVDASGRSDEDVVELLTQDGSLPVSRGYGSDADSIGLWAERGVLGTQLGPNRNGRHW